MTKLIAKERFFYNGRNLEAGEEFEAIEQDVALLTHSVSPRAISPLDPVAPAPKRQYIRSGKYSRRDMRPEE